MYKEKFKSIINDKQLMAQLVVVAMANIGSAINFIISILVVRLVDPTEYANYLATSSLVIILFSILSFVPYLILKNNILNVEVAADNVLNKINMFSFMVVVLIFIFSPALKWLVKFDSYLFLFISVLNSFLLSKLMIFGSISQNRHKYIYVGLKDILIYFLKLLMILIFVDLFSRGQISIFISEIISATLVLFIFTKLELDYFRFNLSRSFIAENYSFVRNIKQYIIATFVLNFILFIDALILKRYLDAESSSVVFAAFNLSKILVYFSGPINLILYQYAVVSDEKKSFYKAFGFSFVGMTIIAIIAQLNIESIAKVIFGIRYGEFGNHFGLALLYSLMIALSTLGINRILAKQNYRFIKFIFLTAIGFVPIFEYISSWGTIAVEYGLLAFSFFCLVIVGYFTLVSLAKNNKLIEEKVR